MNKSIWETTYTTMDLLTILEKTMSPGGIIGLQNVDVVQTYIFELTFNFHVFQIPSSMLNPQPHVPSIFMAFYCWQLVTTVCIAFSDKNELEAVQRYLEQAAQNNLVSIVKSLIVDWRLQISEPLSQDGGYTRIYYHMLV